MPLNHNIIYFPRKILIGTTAPNEACTETFSSKDTILLLFLNCSGHRKMVVNRRYTTAYKLLFPFHPVDCSLLVEKQVNEKTNTSVFKMGILMSGLKYLGVLHVHIDFETKNKGI